MKRRRFDGSDTRKVLTAMITDQVVCSRIASQWEQGGLFDSDWANLVGGWCCDYFRRYSQPPKEQITTIFQQWADETQVDDKIVNAIESFLQGLSDSYEHTEEYPSQYLLDVAAKLFNKTRMQKEMESAKMELEQGRIVDAEERLTRLRKVELGLGSYVEPADEFEVWRQAFEFEKQRPLVTYPGAAGQFFGDSFVRGTLFSFMGPDKTGKTVYLIDLAYRAVRKRSRVALFDTGDGDQDEVMIRLGCRAAGKPERAGDYEKPVGWDDEGQLITSKIEAEAIDPVDGFKAFKRIAKKDDVLRISCHPNSSISIDGIDGLLDDWEKDGWVPDVVVIDYADILAPLKGVRDTLEQIDETWKRMRRMSQSRHCLVVTASQSNAAAYGRDKGVLGKQHFSGRKTKLAHVNGMIGINVSEDERKLGMGRLNWVVRRKMKGRRTPGVVTVAGWFDVENPILQSRW